MASHTIKTIKLESEEGAKLLATTASKQTLLIRLFKKQDNGHFCGIHSSALLMSAQHFGKSFQDSESQETCDLQQPPYTEANLLSFEGAVKAVDVNSANEIGLTIDEVYNMITSMGRNAKKYHTSQTSVEEFRTLASQALSHQDSSYGIIANFDESMLQDPKIGGHFSPLAAYHEGADMFLLMDTWWNTDNIWLKTDDLFHTMDTVDSDSGGKKRGFVIIEP